MMAEEVYNNFKFIRPDWFIVKYRERRKPRKYCTIHDDVCEQLQEDLDLLKRNHNNTCDHQDMEKEEESHKQNRKRKRNNEEEDDEKINPNFNTSDDDGEEEERNHYLNTSFEKEEERNTTERNPWGMTINVGDKFDIPTLLCSSSRDYLIRNNGDKVQIKDHFFGKHVLLYFWNLSDDNPLPHEFDTNLHEDSKEIYREYSPPGQFEIVFVALGNNEKVFNEAFSVMPWLAIPHEDQEGRDLIDKKFAIKSSPLVRSVLFDLDGKVLLDDCVGNFRYYGPEGFPFNREKIVEIEHADKVLQKKLLSLKKLPLKELLGEFVFSSEGKQVSASDLEDHTVGLHFFDLSRLGKTSIEVLMDTWKSLKDDPNKKFAIISINKVSTCLSHFKDKFQEEYRDIPWYTLPYDGRSLCRILHVPLENDDISSNAGHFIIIEHDRYQPLNYFALDVLEIYGIAAFPFTLERAVEIEKKKQQKLKLCKFLSPSAPLRRGCCTRYKEDTVSNLLGERVLLLFATNSSYSVGSFLTALKRMYLEKKATKDHFEIIYISLDCNLSHTSFSRSIKKMPWLVHSFVPDFAVALAKKVFGFIPRLPAIAAFGSGGNFQTKESNLLFKERWSSEYPFIQADMGDEVCKELMDKYRWDFKQVFPDFTSAKEIYVS